LKNLYEIFHGGLIHLWSEFGEHFKQKTDLIILFNCAAKPMCNFGKKLKSVVFNEVGASVNEVFVSQLVILNVPEQDF